MLKPLLKQEWQQWWRNPSNKRLLVLAFVLPFLLGFFSLRLGGTWLSNTLNTQPDSLNYAWLGPAESELLYLRLKLNRYVSIDTSLTETQALEALSLGQIQGLIYYQSPQLQDSSQQAKPAEVRLVYGRGRSRPLASLKELETRLEEVNRRLGQEALKARALPPNLMQALALKSEVLKNSQGEISILELLNQAMQSSLHWTLSLSWLLIWLLVAGPWLRQHHRRDFDAWVLSHGFRAWDYYWPRSLVLALGLSLAWLLTALAWFAALSLPYGGLIEGFLGNLRAYWSWPQVLAYWLLWSLTGLSFWLFYALIKDKIALNLLRLFCFLALLAYLFLPQESLIFLLGLPMFQLFAAGPSFLNADWSLIFLALFGLVLCLSGLLYQLRRRMS